MTQIPPCTPALTASALVALASGVGVITRSPVAAGAILAAALVAAMAGHAYGRRAGHRDMAHRLRYAGEDLAALQEDLARVETDQAFGEIIREHGLDRLHDVFEEES